MTGGFWVTFEGGDGSGKTTQADRLANALAADGFEVLRTREPGGTDVGRTIRQLVLHEQSEITPRAEALLFAADRAQHIITVVSPALARGDVVVQDRYLDSSVAYQGAGRILDPDDVRRLSLWATDDAVPDLTVLLDLDPAQARARLNSARKPYDRMEAERAEFHTRVREAFLTLAAASPHRYLVVDATRDPDDLAASIRRAVVDRLTTTGQGGADVGHHA